MSRYEYKVVPAPERAPKQRGLKGAELFAQALEDLMNQMAAEGWRYLRADTLPQEERSGLASKTTTYRNVLVFQRAVPEAAEVPLTEAAPQPDLPPAPQAETPAPVPIFASTAARPEPLADPAPSEKPPLLQALTPDPMPEAAPEPEPERFDEAVTQPLFPNRNR